MILKAFALISLAVATVAEECVIPVQQESISDDDQIFVPQPYSFNFETDDEQGNQQFRRENSDESGRVQGSYGYKDALGIERIVEYVADKNGYRAHIRTNEPGTFKMDPASVVLNANPIEIAYDPNMYAKPQEEFQKNVNHNSASAHKFEAKKTTKGSVQSPLLGGFRPVNVEPKEQVKIPAEFPRQEDTQRHINTADVPPVVHEQKKVAVELPPQKINQQKTFDSHLPEQTKVAAEFPAETQKGSVAPVTKPPSRPIKTVPAFDMHQQEKIPVHDFPKQDTRPIPKHPTTKNPPQRVPSQHTEIFSGQVPPSSQFDMHEQQKVYTNGFPEQRHQTGFFQQQAFSGQVKGFNRVPDRVPSFDSHEGTTVPPYTSPPPYVRGNPMYEPPMHLRARPQVRAFPQASRKN